MQHVTVTVTRSAADDEAVLVLIDTEFEPDGSDDGPGLRVLLNDADIYTGVERGEGELRDARFEAINVTVENLTYLSN